MSYREHTNGGPEGHGNRVAETVSKLPDGPPTILAEGRVVGADKAANCMPSASDGAGREKIAAEADAQMPAPSSDLVEGQPGYADKAPGPSPSTNDGEGRLPTADKASASAPSPSDIRGEGRIGCAEEANGRSPSPESGETGHAEAADKAVQSLPVSPLISQLAELQYRRKFYIGLVNKQTNAAKAVVRRALGWRYDAEDKEKVNGRAATIVAAAIAGKEPKADDAAIMSALAMDLAIISDAVRPPREARERIEKDMKRMVRNLPVYPWAKAVHGFGDLGLAVLVGEAGDIGSYRKKGHLWKRLGLAPFRGKAMATWRRDGGLSADDWIAAGYAPRRRAEVYAVISDPLFRQQTVVQGPYRAIYDQRRAATATAHPDWTKAHSHADALRVMTKHFVRDLRVAWRRASPAALEWAGKRTPAANLNRSEAEQQTPQSAATGPTPSSEPIRQPDAGVVNEQEASRFAPRNEARVHPPTAQPSRRKAGCSAPQTAVDQRMPTGDPIRRKAKDVAPKADTAQPCDDEREAIPDAPRSAAEKLSPTARSHTKRRKAMVEAAETLEAGLPT